MTGARMNVYIKVPASGPALPWQRDDGLYLDSLSGGAETHGGGPLGAWSQSQVVVSPVCWIGFVWLQAGL